MDGFVAPESPIAQNSFVAPESPIPDIAPNREAIEPGIMGDTVPMEQKLLNNSVSALSGATLPSAITGLVKGAASLGGKALNAIPATKNFVPTVGDMADNMLLKGMGTRVGQIKQAGGLQAARDAAQVGREAGVGDVFSTERGRIQALKDLTEKQGQQIGALRTQAGPATPGVLDQVQAHLQAKYNPANEDFLSSEAGDVGKSLKMINNTAGEAVPTNAGIAKGITALNKYNTGVKTLQPTNAMTEVANNASAANNADIAQKLGPEGAKAYADALHRETGAFHLQPFIEKGAAREAVGRGGGQNILQSLLQKGADAGGYRVASKGIDTLHGALNAPMPNLAPIAPNLMNQQLEEYLKAKYSQGQE